jgi:hypothetical protein
VGTLDISHAVDVAPHVDHQVGHQVGHHGPHARQQPGVRARPGSAVGRHHRAR